MSPTISVTATDDATLGIDAAAITGNTQLIASRVAVPLLAVVKGDGYGHGAVTVALAALAGGATALGVTGLPEAARLRAAGIIAPVLSWMNPGRTDGADAVALDTALAVGSTEQLRAVARSRSGVAVHLQLDTGMARDGAPPHEWDALIATAAELSGRGDVHVTGVMSHLAFADVAAHPRTRAALALFRRGVASIRSAGLTPRHIHLAATSAALGDPSTRGTLARIGAGLVGVDLSGTLALRPAMRLSARLVEVHDVAAGVRVGYGGTWTASTSTRLGLIPLGYGDGLPRVPSGSAEVTIGGARRPVVGAVSMNAMVVDLGATGAGHVGDAATVLGDSSRNEPTAQDWARWAGTIPQDVLTSIGRAGRRHTS